MPLHGYQAPAVLASGSNGARSSVSDARIAVVTDDDTKEAEEEDDDDDESDDDFPRVVLGKLEAISRWLPESMAKGYGDRPVWFILGMDAEIVSVFERIPEDPMPKGRAAAILGALRAFATERNADLQRVLGVTDSIEVGFHVDAPLNRVRASFEEDGFLVAATIEAGDLKLRD
jgi:hypothetical protein